MVDLNKEIKYVKGVGPNREVLLNKLKIYDKNINIIVCLKEFDS